MGDAWQRWRRKLNGHTGHVVLAAALAMLALLLADPLRRAMNPEPLASAPQAPPPAALPAVPVEPDATVLNVVVRNSDTLEQIFRTAGLNLADLAAIRALDGARAYVDRLTRGEMLTIRHRGGDVTGFDRNLSLTQRLHVTRDDGFHLAIEQRPVQTVRTVASGRIQSSLFEAADDAGLQDQTILELAKLFGWDIDFALALRAGDTFTVNFERLYQDGHFVQDGAILAARFVNDGRTYMAVRYMKTDGSVGYYSPTGHPMQKAFLRAPLEFRRVSSGFSRGRYHPILNRIRAHQGVDYAAAQGTPVYAAGSGRIQFRGQKGGYGSMVEIDHGGGIVTAYGHLSGFAAISRAGAHVEQGQTIGFVGMTGLATGPHLHYEYRVNGQFLDPQRVKLPDTRLIDEVLMPDFLRQTAPLLAALENPQPAAAR
jgi:murein DD-endopeptidase MepM/ murein hydrolase activator NlpD